MSDNWVVQNLENALATWNEKLAEIWHLITQSPEQFKGGTIWNVVLLIHDTMQAIGLALLVLFFVVGVVKTCGSFAEIKRPEAAVKLFIVGLSNILDSELIRREPAEGCHGQVVGSAVMDGKRLGKVVE